MPLSEIAEFAVWPDAPGRQPCAVDGPTIADGGPREWRQAHLLERKMQIMVNGRMRDYQPANLAELWRAETQDGDTRHDAASEPRGYAIALNGAVVRRDAWARTPINEGDRIEIVRAVQGG